MLIIQWGKFYFDWTLGRRKVMLAVIPVMSLCLFGNAFVESYWQYAGPGFNGIVNDYDMNFRHV